MKVSESGRYEEEIRQMPDRGGASIVLRERRESEAYEDTALPRTGSYRDTALPRTGSYRDAALPQTGAYRDTALPRTGTYRDTALPPGRPRYQVPLPEIPEKIREMRKLYEYGDGSFSQKCRNFVKQARFMEDYEDDAAWTGEFRRFFPTYHDLNIKQLQGYFTWRTAARKGTFGPAPASMAYLYLYELLGGIGAESPEDSLRKMKEFEAGFLDSGIGDPGMRKNLRRWMLEYAVIHQMPAGEARACADPAVMERDLSLSVLREPGLYGDGEVFRALCFFAGNTAARSPAANVGERGVHLFSAVWRFMSEHFKEGDRNLFACCFGSRRVYPWHPLSNAVWLEDDVPADMEYELNPCRIFRCRGGVWEEERYENLFFDRERFRSAVRGTDRLLRRYLKTGHYLRSRPEEEWVSPFVEAVLQAEKQAELLAKRPKISIDLSGLERIRSDAAVTRDSLLIGEGAEEQDGEQTAGYEEKTDCVKAAEADEPGGADSPPLLSDPLHIRILRALLRGESAEELMRENHLLPSVAADAVNEALFDEIGDSVLECDGNRITLVEDYREDLEELLGN